MPRAPRRPACWRCVLCRYFRMCFLVSYPLRVSPPSLLLQDQARLLLEGGRASRQHTHLSKEATPAAGAV